MQVLLVVQTLSLFRRFHTISRKYVQPFRTETKKVRDLLFWLLQKVPFPKKMQNFQRRNTKKNWKQEQKNIRPFPTRSQTASTKNWEVKYVSQFRDTFSEVESHAHMIVYFPPESVQGQQKLSWMRNMAS